MLGISWLADCCLFMKNSVPWSQLLHFFVIMNVTFTTSFMENSQYLTFLICYREISCRELFKGSEHREYHKQLAINIQSWELYPCSVMKYVTVVTTGPLPHSSEDAIKFCICYSWWQAEGDVVHIGGASKVS